MFELKFKRVNDLKKFLLELKVDVPDLNVVANRGLVRTFYLKSLPVNVAESLQAEAFNKACYLALPKAAHRLAGNCPALLIGSLAGLQELQRTLAVHGTPALNKVAERLRDFLKWEEEGYELANFNIGVVNFDWRMPNWSYELSFGTYWNKKTGKFKLKELVNTVNKAVKEGVKIVEITLEGLEQVERAVWEEALSTAFAKLKKLPLALALRSNNLELLPKSLEAGANFLSDPTGLTDPKFLSFVLERKLPIVLSYGGPDLKNVEDKLLKVHNFFAEKVGVLRAQEFDKILLKLPREPEILQELQAFSALKCPLWLASGDVKIIPELLTDLSSLKNGAQIVSGNNLNDLAYLRQTFTELPEGLL